MKYENFDNEEVRKINWEKALIKSLTIKPNDWLEEKLNEVNNG